MRKKGLTIGHLKLMNIGKMYWKATRAGLYEQQKDAVQNYFDHFLEYYHEGIGIYLWGQNGFGKSSAAAVLCKWVWGEYSIPSYFITSFQLRDVFTGKDGYIDPDDWNCDILISERIKEVKFLVIDDIGKDYRSDSGYIESCLGGLIQARRRSLKVTCYTSNINPAKLHQVYNQSISGIIKECTIPLEIKGEDIRNKARLVIK